MRPLAALAALLLLAAPAAAQTVTHSVDGRFGVAYDGGARAGAGALRGIHDTQYTMTIRRPFDNGWSVAASVAVGVGNVERRGPRVLREVQPGLRFDGPGY